jgi:DNA-binding transcriptional MerR regulator
VHTVGVESSLTHTRPTSGEELAQFSVQELSESSGVPVSSIRMYQQRKLLDPPHRRGRSAVYETSHLDRLLLIERLQLRGYSLAAILDVVTHQTEALDKVIDREVPALAEQSVTMTLVELIQKLPAADFSLETLQRTQALGLLKINGSEVTLTQPSFLDAGQALTGMNVPTGAILDSYEFLRGHVVAIANDFARVFDTYAESAKAVRTKEVSAEQIQQATEQLELLAKTAVDVVSSELRHALRAIALERLASLSSVPNERSSAKSPSKHRKR